MWYKLKLVPQPIRRDEPIRDPLEFAARKLPGADGYDLLAFTLQVRKERPKVTVTRP
jgi:hypothetical protein